MKREEGHIDQVQGVMLVFAVLSAKLFAHYPALLIEGAGPAAWQAALVMTLTAMLIFLPSAALARRFPGKGLAEISESVAGPWLGPLLTLAVTAWLFTSLALGVRLLAETYIGTMLPQTPPSALIMVLLFCVAYASYRGLEPLSRAAQLIFPLIVLVVVLVMIFSMPRANSARLLPVAGFGLPATLGTGLYCAGMGAEAILALAIGYAFRSGKALQNSVLLGIALFGLFMTVMAAVLVSLFGAPEAAQLPFPMFNMSRLISLGRFLQRVEAITVMFWFFAWVVRLSALFHGTVVSLAGALQLPYYRPLIFPLAVLTMACSLLPEDFLSTMDLDSGVLRPIGLLVLALPLVLLGLAVIRRKGGPAHAA